jgi:predicted site-specific integrase-resolvase
MTATIKNETKQKQSTPTPAPLMVRVSDAARMLSVSDTTVRRYCAAGILPYGWLNGQRRIRVSDIERLVDQVLRGKM